MIARDQLIQHILFMRQHDEDYACAAMLDYHAAMPWLDLLDGVKQALKGEK